MSKHQQDPSSMRPTYASVASVNAAPSLSLSAGAPTLTPDSRDPAIVGLRTAMEDASDYQVLRHVMGFERVPNIPAIADGIANHVILVTLDCEHWSNNTDKTTEVGINQAKRTDLVRVVASGDLGDHGEHLLQQLKFNLLRISENSHLPCQNPDSRGVNGNRFGEGRFVNFEEAREVMKGVFVQPLNNIADLGDGNYPIVVLGQDVGHDKNNLAKKELAVHIEGFGTVVRWIDTQVLARDVGYWLKPKNEQIGLERLVYNLMLEHTDRHTASNDAARTVISAFQLGLKDHPCKKGRKKSMLQVATDIEAFSVANFTPIGGVEEYCWRCGTPGHMKEACVATDLFCEHCSRHECDREPHVTMHCLCFANEKAKQRRDLDAQTRTQRKADKAARKNSRRRSGDRGGFPPSGGARGGFPPPGRGRGRSFGGYL
jgi:hypothetical protein